MNGTTQIIKWLKDKQMQNKERAFVTLSYAQSLDGSIALRKNKALHLSGEESRVLSHRLRALHDALLVGIGTILTDNPQLNVRHVRGQNPQTVVLDSALRLPLNSRLLEHKPKPWVFTNDRARKDKKKTLEKTGTRVLRAKANDQNQIDIDYVLRELYFLGMTSILVEGGASIIANFVRNNSIDAVVLFLIPVYVGGLNVLGKKDAQDDVPREDPLFPSINIAGYERVNSGIVIWGEFCGTAD